MSVGRTDILMYHSISDARGATSISPAVFAAQMDAIARARVPVISMDEVATRHAGVQPVPYAIAITFDDGFQDFADTAWPVLQSHGFGAIVYLPTGCIGGAENWPGCATPARPIMNWDTITRLAGQGVQFGAHTVDHTNLTGLDGSDLADQIERSGQMIGARLAQPVPHFAPPYGATNLAINQRIAQSYATSVGTRLGSVRGKCDLHDLPRLEMFYFTNPGHWRRHLAKKGALYLQTRRMLRGVREIISKPWERT